MHFTMPMALALKQILITYLARLLSKVKKQMEVNKEAIGLLKVQPLFIAGCRMVLAD